ncbi:MAG: phosphotransferase [Bacteroidota bacterium]
MQFILKAEELEALENYLKEKKWIAPDESLNSASKPGEGNMNYTLRIRTNFRNFIIKQSRDYVEKYPQISAPRERAIIEGKFYELIQENATLKAFTPEITAMDEVNSIIVLEDLGESNDYTFIYEKGKEISSEDLKGIMNFASILHQNFRNEEGPSPVPNRAMRELNAEHIFNYPFMEENGFDLNDVTPGLQDIALTYKTDQTFKSVVQDLSSYYTEDGKTLLHGDYYPGSWLKTLEGVRIIDPEFCFYGQAEFDVSVTLAHMLMAEQSSSIQEQVLKDYEAPEDFSQGVVYKLAGIEIMRRLIGLAQLPLPLDLNQKEALLKEAYKMVMS